MDQRIVKFFVLRAARDPLTIEGEWRFILPRTEALIDFQQSVMFYTDNVSRPRAIRKWRSYNSLQFLSITTCCNLGSAHSRRATVVD